jgi:hypothetical protein
MRDLRVQLGNGVAVPSWAQPVLTALADAADVESPAIGTTVANVGPGESRARLVVVAEAAAAVGLSEEYIRRLVRTHRVLGERAGARTWLVDLDSLKGVIGSAQQDRAS